MSDYGSSIAQSLLRGSNTATVQERLLSYLEALEAAGEPLLALRVVEQLPAILKASPVVAHRRSRLEHKLRHLKTLDAFAAAYEKDNRPPLSDSGLLDLPRYGPGLRFVQDSKPKHVVSFGCGDGTIEDQILGTGVPRLTLVDVSLKRLSCADHLRSRHPLASVEAVRAASFYAFPKAPGALLWLCEVLEHVPNPEALLKAAYKSGVSSMYLSTPDGSFWYEPSLPTRDDDWYEHVSAQTPETLYGLLEKTGFKVRHLGVTQDGTIICVADRKAT